MYCIFIFRQLTNVFSPVSRVRYWSRALYWSRAKRWTNTVSRSIICPKIRVTTHTYQGWQEMTGHLTHFLTLPTFARLIQFYTVDVADLLQVQKRCNVMCLFLFLFKSCFKFFILKHSIKIPKQCLEQNMIQNGTICSVILTPAFPSLCYAHLYTCIMTWFLHLPDSRSRYSEYVHHLPSWPTQVYHHHVF